MLYEYIYANVKSDLRIKLTYDMQDNWKHLS
jgi:hypothetical protein